MAKSPTESNTEPTEEKDAEITASEVSSEASEEVVDAELIDETPSEEGEAPVEEGPEAEPVEEGVSEAPPAPTIAETSETDSKQGNFVPLLLGGAAAGAIGFAVAVFYPQILGRGSGAPEYATLSELEALKAAVEAAPPGLTAEEVAPLINAQTQPFSIAIEGLNDKIDALSERFESALAAPADAGALTPAALAAYQDELDALRADLTGQQARIQAMVSVASTQLEQATAQSQQFEETAAEASRSAALRIAIARIQTALETGTPFTAALPELELALGDAIPSALSSVASEGVSTLTMLQTEFDGAADRALATARAEGVDGEERTAIGAFIRRQLNVRSVTSQEGTSVDAILSRAQAALGEARLNDALAEIASLPEVARAEMADWISRAETRAAALSAVDALSLSLNDK